jgi:alpha-beta hydrolase superfamily lysophospholipase
MPVPAFPSASRASHQEGFLNSGDHLRLYWQRYRPLPGPARATVAVLHGGGDHSGRYPALTSGLVEAGFEVALLDFRGHGQSDGRRWYVDRFSDYLADIDAFLERLCQDGYAGKLFVAAHSMGSLIAARWGVDHWREPAGFVLSSPYLRLAMRPPAAKIWGARLLGKVVPWLPVATGIDFAALTSDEELQAWTAHDPLYGRSTTPRWFDESLRAQAEVTARAGEFRAPLLVLAAGADTIADPVASRAFVDAASSTDKTFVLYPGFRHEIFNEVGRARPVAEAVAWLTVRAG